MAILKIKDKGVWKEIQAIKGDTGHDVYVGDKSKAPSEAKLIIEPVKGTATGTDIQVTDSANDRVSKLVLDGKSTQETRSGKNLIKLKKGYTLTKNGVTFKVNDDYSITLNGTCNEDNTALTFNTSVAIPSAGAYTLSSKFVSGSISNKTNFTRIQIQRSSDWAGITLKLNNEDGYNTSQISVGKYNVCNIRIDNNVVLSNYTIKIQLEEGSTATDWEQFGVMPSPDYPSEIENVKGKNLFKPTLATKVGSGITCTANRDGTYTLNGTATADAYFTIGDDSNLTVGKTYKFVGCPSGGSNTKYKMSWGFHGYEYGNGLVGKKTSEARNVQIIIFKGVTVSNLIFKPMFTENTSSTYNDYVPYGNIQILETGKNLLNNTLISNTLNGITYVVNEDKSVILKSGTATAITWLILNSSITLEAGTYTMSSGNISNTIRMYCVALGGYTSDGIRTKTLTSSQTSDVAINIPNGTSITTPITIYPMIERGSAATNYEPYTEEVVNIDLKGNELCSLPNGTKDELIVKDGRAKILKRIGKVVLDGSEDWRSLTTIVGNRFYLIKDDAIVPTVTTIPTILSNNFSYITPGDSWSQNIIGISLNTGSALGQILIKYNTSDTDNVAKFKTWLSTHNTIVQYELKEPYEIDLGEVSMFTTYEGTSNITNSEDAEMSIEYVTNKTNLYYQNNGNIIKMNEGS